MNAAVVDALASRLRELRPAAMFAVLSRADSNSYEALDRLANLVGFRAIGRKWLRIDKDQATLLLKRVLESDLAYDSVEMDPDQAKLLADQFLEIPKSA